MSRRPGEVWTPPIAFPGRRDFFYIYRRTVKNRTHEGVGTCALAPFGVSPPLDSSMRKTTTLSECSLATTRNLPLGSIPKFRGHFPPTFTAPRDSSFPLAASIEKIATLSCPRFEPYKNFPLGCTSTSAQ